MNCEYLSKMSCVLCYISAYLRDVEQQAEWLGSGETENSGRKAKALSRIQQALIAAQELGDEKLNVVQNLLDLIENKTRQLDQDYRNLGELLIIIRSLFYAFTGFHAKFYLKMYYCCSARLFICHVHFPSFFD